MTLRARKLVASLSAVGLLTVQAPQVVAACICEMMCGETCSHEMATPDPAPEPARSCCDKGPAELPVHCQMLEAAPSVPPTASDHASITRPCCERELVISTASRDATVPLVEAGTPSGHASVVATVASVPVVARPGTPARLGTLRAPPPDDAPPIFLLTASLLI